MKGRGVLQFSWKKNDLFDLLENLFKVSKKFAEGVKEA